MFQSFRLTMAWVHTWFGLALGFVLMAAFFFGTLSVFDREIDRWSVPESRFEPQPIPSFDKVLRPFFEAMQPGKEEIANLRARLPGPIPERFETVSYWQAFTTHRDPVLGLYAGYEVPGTGDAEELAYAERFIDPRTGKVFDENQFAIGTGLFYPLHFNLTLHWKELGAWIVGLAALAMLAALVSGVVIHRKIFREFFTFRLEKGRQRGTLDLHNLTGVVALPFHFFFAFTGLTIFAGIYFPVTQTQLHPLQELHEQQEARVSGVAVKRAGVTASLASVDAMVAEAQRRWAARGLSTDVGSLVLVHVGDANGYVSVERTGLDRVAFTGNAIRFRASSGEVLHEDPPLTVVGHISGFLAGLHLVPFRDWSLRWLYVLGGLAGCVCIATGFLFFVEKRKRQHAKQDSQGARVIAALAVTTVTGMLIATLGILVANRLLPAQLPAGWPGRAELQLYAFWIAWLLASIHAFWRTAPVARGLPAPAWHDQCWAIAVLALIAVLSNWITTGDHLVKTLRNAFWPVAGMDLALLISAAIAVFAARTLRQARHA